MRRLVLTCAAAGLALAGVSSAIAQELSPADQYARGVHAYFSADYAATFNALTALIKAGSTDPRAYYFRGLAAMNLGRQPDAQADFAKGAQLEAQEGTGSDIGKSLERVQGRNRLTLEGYRSLARVGSVRQRENKRLETYDAIQMLEADKANPTGNAPSGGELPSPDAKPAAPANPFGAPAEPEKKADNPFGT
jgi:tetratricopeptide (TPR) repeat protein